jgi:hypothetical protein
MADVHVSLAVTNRVARLVRRESRVHLNSELHENVIMAKKTPPFVWVFFAGYMPGHY